MTITSGATPRGRVHITDPRDWGHSVGTDYWLLCNDVDMAAAGGMDLVNYGWESDGFSFTAFAGDADFMSSSDKGTTGGFNFDTAEDTLLSPAMFGDWVHIQQVASILGASPTTLSCEFIMRLAAGNDEEGTGIGFWIGAATDPVTKAETEGVVTCDGTDFSLETSAAADAGSTKATTAHVFRVTLTFGSTMEWFIDGTSQGTAAITADKYPLKFGGGTANGGANDPVLASAHVWYA